jgi:hypothetical protein
MVGQIGTKFSEQLNFLGNPICVAACGQHVRTPTLREQSKLSAFKVDHQEKSPTNCRTFFGQGERT